MSSYAKMFLAAGLVPAVFAPAGKVVWKWHDPVLAGAMNNVIVADDLDFAEFQDDADLASGADAPKP